MDQSIEPTSRLPRDGRRNPGAPFDRAALAKRIARLSAEVAQRDEFRKAVVSLFQQVLTDGHARAREALEAGGRGLACARFLCDLEDELIRAIHDCVTRHIYPIQNPSTAERMAVCAVGGYGRGTLAPGSDIDLLFLFPTKQTGWGESVVEATLYILWDLKQKVGHSTRSIDECLRQAHGDITIRTALLEARFILGEQPLFELMRERFEKEIVRGSAREFVAAKLAERDQRVTRAGASRYLVEPNVKEGKGGLRDLNTLFWIGKYVYRVRRVEELVEAGLFTPQELKLFERCEEFLWRVRCHLHFVAGRAEERLSFDKQRVIAERLGYVSHAGLSGVERFMKHYFLVAKDVGDLTAIVCAALEEKEAKPRAALDRFVGRFRRRRKAVHFDDFAVEVDRVTVARPDIFDRDPVNLIRLFWLSDTHGLA
ncbi:MAG: nucleotidyltransferase domain-containing protein, partial [Rhodoblastus sp.]|nr:nucleotidyltransferase domain-containing protein [Rhodoblastus sp.]